jgi:DNA topoisomerase-1
MAKSKPPKAKSGKPSHALVIVESPAKARTISKYLGNGFTVEASIGHVRDLPQGAAQIPAEFKGESWSNLGVNVNDNFTPIYIVPPGKSKQIKLLKDRLKEADALYLATDEDREEGHQLAPVGDSQAEGAGASAGFEITKDAIQAALASPRSVDDGLVRAQETRRILDRLYGYEVSPLLWRKVRPKLSAGRVQSVAVRMIVERERERMAFVSASWWDIIGQFEKTNGQQLQAEIVSVDGRKIPSGKDFDSSTGKLKNNELMLLDGAAAAALASAFAVASSV